VSSEVSRGYGYSERSDDKGCWRCVSYSPPGHAFFCGCRCHEAEFEAVRRRKRASVYMQQVLGTKQLGPFPGFHVDRHDDGMIHACVAERGGG
jgi:hypothetical protein